MFLRLSRISRPQLIILFEPVFDLKSRECRLYISKRFTFVAGVYSIFFAAVLAFSQDGRQDGHDWAEKSVRYLVGMESIPQQRRFAYSHRSKCHQT